MKTVFFSANYLLLKGKSYGGGAFFVQNLYNFLKKKGYNITFQLKGKIDAIIIFDPRTEQPYKKYSLQNIIDYKKKYPKVKIIHRVNENDIKRLKSIGIEKLLVKTMLMSNLVIFVSEWLRKYFIEKYKLKINSCSIINGCDQTIFYPKTKRNDKNILKIVTHHWSSNYLKGFHIYNKLDKMLEKRKNIQFTYIGNYNKDYKPKNIKVLPPCSGKKLADLLRKSDFYLTATQNEPGAMHYLEGASCGLPILYCKNGGGAHEVCKNYGLKYTDINDFFIKLKIINDKYDTFVKNDYSKLSEKRCCLDYFEKIKGIL